MIPARLWPTPMPIGTILVVHAKRDHGALKSRVGHPRHGQEEFAGQETGLISHRSDNGTARRGEQYLRPSQGEPICRFT